MPFELLQRRAWDGEPQELGDVFRLHKRRGRDTRVAVCRLLTHVLGWEVRLEVDGELQRSQVCRSQDEVLTLGEQWGAALREKGWI
jgi:hypothetical protein